MLALIKTPIQAALGHAGISVRRIRAEPYQHLWKVPRYTETTVDLLGRPFRIADARSFFFSYREIFVEEIYRFETRSPAPRIIDCGSNYGTSIVYFDKMYPGARITGVEADPEIYKLLARNCAHIDADLLNMAVSHDKAPLKFFSEGSDGGRAAHEVVDPKAVTEVEALTLDDLIDGTVDFLKIDIEGSEANALAACTKLSMVQQLFIEYHSFKNSPQLLGPLLNKLTAEGFRYYVHEQFCSPAPLTREELQLGMDLQLNIFAKRPET
jgi:FkbM family methyltransferase